MDAEFFNTLFTPVQNKSCSLKYIRNLLMMVAAEPILGDAVLRALLCNEERLYQIIKATDQSYEGRNVVAEGLATTRQLLNFFNLTNLKVTSKKSNTFCFLHHIPTNYVMLDRHIIVGSKIIQDLDVSKYQIKHVKEDKYLSFYSLEQQTRLCC